MKKLSARWANVSPEKRAEHMRALARKRMQKLSHGERQEISAKLVRAHKRAARARREKL